MSPTTAVLTALTNLFQSNGVLLATFPTWTKNGATVYSFYAELAKVQSPFPYVVYSLVSAGAVSVYGGIEFAEPYVRFTSYADSLIKAQTNADAMCDVLDATILNLVGGKVMLMSHRLGDPVPRMDSCATDGSGAEVWGSSVVYHFAA